MLRGECQQLPVFPPSIINTVNPPLLKQIEIPSTCPTFSSLARFYRNHCFWSQCSTTTRHKHRYYYNNRRAKTHSEKAVYRLNRHKIFIHSNCRYSFRRFEWCHGFRDHNNTSLPLPSSSSSISIISLPQPIVLPPLPPLSSLSSSSKPSSVPQKQHQQQLMLLGKTSTDKTEWIPPINAESLEELSLPHLFKSLQLRHDLLSDPNLCFRPNLDGPSGREKRKKADRYWKRVDSLIKVIQHDDYITSKQSDFIKVIIVELVTILESLVDPFKSILTGFINKFHWEWPIYISINDIRDIFDPDLILQQISHKCLSIEKQIEILGLIFDSMCPDHHQIRIELMHRYFREQRYAKALDQCFKLLEIIKLDCANRALVHYRNYLIETCAEYEYRYFIKQYSKHTFDLTTTYNWFKSLVQNESMTVTHASVFKEIYYKGLVDLMANEVTTHFPITLQFDERRLTHQFRFEFQNMIVIGILLVPYRHLAGKYNRKSDIEKLKSVYTSLLKNNKDEEQVSYHYLALHACEIAMQTHLYFNSKILFNLTETAHFWEEWLSQHLQPTSSIFKLFHKRIAAQLQSYLLLNTVDLLDLSDEVEQLGLKLKHIATLNLDVYGVVYKDIVSQLLLKK